MSDKVGPNIERLNFNDAIFNQFWVDLDIQFQSRCMPYPTFSDNDFKYEELPVIPLSRF